jgi:hypothetical protein
MIQRLLASVFQLLLRIRTGTASSETLPRRNVAKAPSGRSLHSAPGRGVRSPGVNVPNHFVPRQEALQALKEGLLNGLSNPVALTGGGKIGVRGMGGVGKSVLGGGAGTRGRVATRFSERG